MNIRRLIDKNHEIWSVQPEIENAVLISFPVVNSTVDCNINVAVKRAKKELVEMIAVYSWIKKKRRIHSRFVSSERHVFMM